VVALKYTPNLGLGKTAKANREREIRKRLTGRFGLHLKTLREQRDLSQEELAYNSGINRTYIGSIETGEYTPSLYIIWKLSQALNLSVSQLLKGFE